VTVQLESYCKLLGEICWHPQLYSDIKVTISEALPVRKATREETGLDISKEGRGGGGEEEERRRRRKRGYHLEFKSK